MRGRQARGQAASTGLPTRLREAIQGSGSRRPVRQIARGVGQVVNRGLGCVFRGRRYAGPARRPRWGEDQTTREVARRLSHAASSSEARRQQHRPRCKRGWRRRGVPTRAGDSNRQGRVWPRAATARARYRVRCTRTGRCSATYGQSEQQRPGDEVAKQRHGTKDGARGRWRKPRRSVMWLVLADGPVDRARSLPSIRNTHRSHTLVRSLRFARNPGTLRTGSTPRARAQRLALVGASRLDSPSPRRAVNRSVSGRGRAVCVRQGWPWGWSVWC